MTTDAQKTEIPSLEELEELRRSHERFLLAAEAIHSQIFDWDVKTNYVYRTRGLVHVIGFLPEEVEPTTDWWEQRIHPEDWEQLQGERWKYLDCPDQSRYSVEYRILDKYNHYAYVWDHGLILRDEEGHPVRVVGSSINITQRKQAEQALQESESRYRVLLQKAAELEKRKDDFISMASHELKTPITTIKVFIQLMKRNFERQGLTEYVDSLAQVETQIDKLTKLVSDLLDVSKIQAGHLDYAEESIDIDALVRHSVETIHQTSETHILSIHGASHQTVIGDSDRLEQVFMNLVNNAIKYSPQADKVDIRIATVQDTVMVSVQDYGIGIPQEHLDKIFDRFYRAHDGNSNEFPGLGMGLYISHEIVKRHAGDLTVESAEGKGSTFTVSLPVKKQGH
jgi:PAS domain S-box-containing protein